MSWRDLRQDPRVWGSVVRVVRETIDAVHAALPEDATLDARIAAVDAAFPFGRRRICAPHKYRIWCRERRQYLRRFGFAPQGGARR